MTLSINSKYLIRFLFRVRLLISVVIKVGANLEIKVQNQKLENLSYSFGRASVKIDWELLRKLQKSKMALRIRNQNNLENAVAANPAGLKVITVEI